MPKSRFPNDFVGIISLGLGELPPLETLELLSLAINFNKFSEFELPQVNNFSDFSDFCQNFCKRTCRAQPKSARAATLPTGALATTLPTSAYAATCWRAPVLRRC